MLRDPHDVLVETHVEHAVCLIQNEHLQRGQIHISQRQMGQHATWCDNDDVRALGEGLLLLCKFLSCSSAINRQRRDARVVGKSLGSLVNLNGELTGGNHDQGFDLAVVGRVHDAVHRRQQKRGRLAGSGLCNAQNVLAFDGVRDGLALNGRGRFKPHGPKSVFNVWMQIKVLETNLFRHRLFLLLALRMLFFHGSKVLRNPCTELAPLEQAINIWR